jgi:hypothetical protein
VVYLGLYSPLMRHGLNIIREGITKNAGGGWKATAKTLYRMDVQGKVDDCIKKKYFPMAHTEELKELEIGLTAVRAYSSLVVLRFETRVHSEQMVLMVVRREAGFVRA